MTTLFTAHNVILCSVQACFFLLQFLMTSLSAVSYSQMICQKLTISFLVFQHMYNSRILHLKQSSSTAINTTVSTSNSRSTTIHEIFISEFYRSLLSFQVSQPHYPFTINKFYLPQTSVFFI